MTRAPAATVTRAGGAWAADVGTNEGSSQAHWGVVGAWEAHIALCVRGRRRELREFDSQRAREAGGGELASHCSMQ